MTEAELSEAVEEYITKGGQVKKLPPSTIPSLNPYHSGRVPEPGEFDGEPEPKRKGALYE